VDRLYPSLLACFFDDQKPLFREQMIILTFFKWFLFTLVLTALISSIWLDYIAIQRDKQKKNGQLIEEMMEKQFRDRMRIKDLWTEKQFWIIEANRLKEKGG
jgi:hypothetical protein